MTTRLQSRAGHACVPARNYQAAIVTSAVLLYDVLIGHGAHIPFPHAGVVYLEDFTIHCGSIWDWVADSHICLPSS